MLRLRRHETLTEKRQRLCQLSLHYLTQGWRQACIRHSRWHSQRVPLRVLSERHLRVLSETIQKHTQRPSQRHRLRDSLRDPLRDSLRDPHRDPLRDLSETCERLFPGPSERDPECVPRYKHSQMETPCIGCGNIGLLRV